MNRLTRLGYLVEEQGMSYLADLDPDNPLAPLQAASCTYRIALGPRAGQKVLSLRTAPGRGDMKIIAAIEEPEVIAKILMHLCLPARAPPRGGRRFFRRPDSRRQERLCSGAENPARPVLVWRGGSVHRGEAIRVYSGANRH